MKRWVWIMIGIVIVCIIMAKGVEPPKEIIIENENKYPCENLSLYNTTYCFRDFVATFYKYVPREDTNKTVKDIIDQGGDCYDYSMLYKWMFESAGFRTSLERIFVKQEGDYIYGHQFLRVEDETGYCNVDQLDVHCFIYG